MIMMMAMAQKWRWLMGLLMLFLMGNGPARAASDPLVFLVHPFDTPSRLFSRFSPLCDYLEEALGRPVQLRIASSYEQQIQDMARGRAHLAYMGPTPYIRARDFFKAPVRLLAAEAEQGHAFYQSVIVVPAGSPVVSLTDMKGRSMAFGAERSFGSHFVPRLMLGDAGVQLADLSRYGHLQRHEQVALAVLHGDYDAGGLRQDIAQQYLGRGLRVIATSEPLPPHAIVAGPALPPELDEPIRRALFGGQTEKARRALRALGAHISFAPVRDADYNPARRVAPFGEAALP
jgi:phosphonate transport system substrate-binding protein